MNEGGAEDEDEDGVQVKEEDASVFVFFSTGNACLW